MALLSPLKDLFRNMNSRRISQSEPYMIVAIDFGTTYSGLCWTWSGNPNVVQPIRGWIDALNGANEMGNQPKVPTRIRYCRNRPASEALWGWNLDEEDTENETTFEWFKLILNYEDLEDQVRNSDRVQRTYKKLERRYGREHVMDGAVTVTTEYLEKLWRNGIEALERSQPPGWFVGMPCKVVLTKPAIWSERACDRTVRAARRAIARHPGPFREIAPLELISEPEAAASAVLAAPSFTLRPDIVRPNDIYVVADCGGGTVDVISYIVRNLNPLQLEECVEGRGDLCGSIFIDEEFELFMRAHVPWQTLERWEKQHIMLNQWEWGIKPRFMPTANQLWRVIVLGRRKSYTSDHIETLFQPACGKVRTLITRQVDEIRANFNEYPRGIFLVGGFGRSTYLFSQLEAQIRAQYRRRIQIIQSNDDEAWMAVCRGAAISVASRQDIARISRSNYGLCYTDHFNPRIHNIERSSWDPVTGQRFYPKMHWIVRRGDVVSHLNPVTFECTQYFSYPEELASGRFKINIYKSTRPDADDQMDQTVTELCKVDCYIQVDFSTLPSFVGSDCVMRRRLNIDIVMSPRGADLQFSVRYNRRALRTEIIWPRNQGPRQNVPLDLEPI